VGFVEQGLASRESADPGEVTKTSRAVERPVLFNAAAVLSNGSLDGVYRKRDLPYYSVFDESHNRCARTRSSDDSVERCSYVIDKARTQQKVLGWISGDRQFGKSNDVATDRVGLVHQLDDA
jgi:hypothetical protein